MARRSLRQTAVWVFRTPLRVCRLPPTKLYRPATPQEARAAVDAMAKRHADIVKIWVDSVGGTKPAMSPEIYRAVIEEAHKHHLRVAAHVYYLADAKSLVNAGVDVLAHSVRDKPVDQELISAMKRRGVWYIPTFTVDESFYIYAQHPGFMQLDFFKDALPPAVLTMLSSDAYSQKVNQDPKTAAAQGGLCHGPGKPEGSLRCRHSGWFWNRLRRLCRPAFRDSLSTGNWKTWFRRGSPRCRLSYAPPRNNAALLGIEATRGTLRPGKRADLIVLAANPLDDITNTRSIVTIFHDGRTVAPRVPVVMAK